MLVESFKHQTHADALAIAAYLKSLPPAEHKLHDPVGPGEKPTSFVCQVIPADKNVPTPTPK